jgi:hypothetical protein
LGVQPPATRPTTTQNPNLIYPGQHPPIFLIPYPFPIAPTCPCYAMHQQGGGQSQQSPISNTQIPYGISFIPVLFVPHCFSKGNNTNEIPGQYLQVPYPCSQCNNGKSNNQELNVNDVYSSSDSFRQVLAQAGINSFDSFLVKSPPRRMRMRKQKRIQKVDDDVKDNESSVPSVLN